MLHIQGEKARKQLPSQRGQQRPGQGGEKFISPVGKKHEHGGKQRGLHHKQHQKPTGDDLQEEQHGRIVALGQLGQNGLTEHMDGQSQKQHQQKEEGIHQAEQPGKHVPPVLLHAVNPIETGEHAKDPPGGGPQRRQGRDGDQGFGAAGEHPGE